MVTTLTKPEDDRQVDVVDFFNEPSRWNTLLTSQRATDGQSRSLAKLTGMPPNNGQSSSSRDHIDLLPCNLNGRPFFENRIKSPILSPDVFTKRCAQESADLRHHHLMFTIQTSCGRNSHWWTQWRYQELCSEYLWWQRVTIEPGGRAPKFTGTYSRNEISPGIHPIDMSLPICLQFLIETKFLIYVDMLFTWLWSFRQNLPNPKSA